MRVRSVRFCICCTHFVNAADLFGFGRVFGARFQIDEAPERNYDDGARRGQLARSMRLYAGRMFGLI